MKIRLLYFASVREKLGSGGETITLDAPAPTLATLCDALRARGESWQQLLGGGTIKFAVNQQFADMDTLLTEECEVAIFPPVTGG